MLCLTNLLKASCEQMQKMEDIKASLRPEFYQQIITQLKGIQSSIIREMQDVFFHEEQKDSVVLSEKTELILPEAYDSTQDMEEEPAELRSIAVQDEEESLPIVEEPSRTEVVEEVEEILFTEPIYEEPLESVEEDVSSIPKIPPSSPQIVAPTEVVTQVSPTEWLIQKDRIIVQEQVIQFTRNGVSEDITFHISPLTIMENGFVPVLVNATYLTPYKAKETSTAMSREGEILLQMHVNDYCVLIKGVFENGVFSASIMSTGRSIEQKDILSIKSIQDAKGDSAVPEIPLTAKAKLWIGFGEANYYGIVFDGEWLDECNETHDVTVELPHDVVPVSITNNEKGWSVKY